MSRHQQVDIRLLPCYEKGFAAHFPALAGVLRRFDYRRPLEEEVSLYELVDVLAGMVRDPLVAGPLRQALRSPVQRMTGLRDEAREFLLARRLNELDQCLYRLEDEFDDLETLLISSKL